MLMVYTSTLGSPPDASICSKRCAPRWHTGVSSELTTCNRRTRPEPSASRTSRGAGSPGPSASSVKSGAGIADAQLVARHREPNVTFECFARSNLLHGATSPFEKTKKQTAVIRAPTLGLGVQVDEGL